MALPLADVIAEGRILLADGAMASNLLDSGLRLGEAPEGWNDLYPHRVQQLHQDFVDAGADLILTNSFGGNRRRLMGHGLAERSHALNAKAARLARSIADGAGRPVIVAGTVGPTGDFLAPLGPLTEAEATDIFAEQIAGLAEGGADLIWIETMSAAEEMRAAATAAARTGLPFTLTASFDTVGRTLAGLTPAAFAEAMRRLRPAPLAIGANCGTGAPDLLLSIMAIGIVDPAAAIIAKASVGLPERRGDRWHYSATSEQMADYARLAIDAGATIIGGCCGASPCHLAAMRQAIDTHVRVAPPSLEEVMRRLEPRVR
jgi:5-methyltetrahydrofolate--homocysteine methyltransferase